MWSMHTVALNCVWYHLCGVSPSPLLFTVWVSLIRIHCNNFGNWITIWWIWLYEPYAYIQIYSNKYIMNVKCTMNTTDNVLRRWFYFHFFFFVNWILRKEDVCKMVKKKETEINNIMYSNVRVWIVRDVIVCVICLLHTAKCVCVALWVLNFFVIEPFVGWGWLTIIDLSVNWVLMGFS